MSISIKQYNGSTVTPQDDARLYELLSGGQVGIVEGCTISCPGTNQLLITGGWGVCNGRCFEIEQETILAKVSTSGTMNGRLCIKIDLSSESPISFETQAASALPALTQEELNYGGSIYEIPLATYQISTVAISGLKTVYTTVSNMASNEKLTDAISPIGAVIASETIADAVRPTGETILASITIPATGVYIISSYFQAPSTGAARYDIYVSNGTTPILNDTFACQQAYVSINECASFEAAAGDTITLKFWGSDSLEFNGRYNLTRII